MKNLNFFEKMSMVRKITFILACVCSLAFAIAIPYVWANGGSPVGCCITGSIFGLFMPIGLWLIGCETIDTL